MNKPIVPNFRGRTACRKGTAAIEAALMMPIVVFIFLGAIDIAQYINMSQIVTNASREGARIASRSTTESEDEVRDTVNQYLTQNYPDVSSDSDTISVSVNRVSGSGYGENTQFASIESGDTISIEVRFNFDDVRWLPGPDYWNGTAYSSETFCRRQ